MSETYDVLAKLPHQVPWQKVLTTSSRDEAQAMFDDFSAAGVPVRVDTVPAKVGKERRITVIDGNQVFTGRTAK